MIHESDLNQELIVKWLNDPITELVFNHIRQLKAQRDTLASIAIYGRALPDIAVEFVATLNYVRALEDVLDLPKSMLRGGGA